MHARPTGGAAGAGPRTLPQQTLPDVLRMLDMNALAALVGSLSYSDLASARLACLALRDACSKGVRHFTVCVSQQLAAAWRLGRRSPLALFPWCTDVTVDVDTHTSYIEAGSEDTTDDDEAQPDDDDDGPRAGRSYIGYSHHHTARLAVAGVSAQALGRIKRLTISAELGSLDLDGVLCVLVQQLPALEALDASGASQVCGMRAADHARPALMYGAIAQHCPLLRELRLPCAPGMLHGVGALAACGGLQALDCTACYWGVDAHAVLGPEEVEGLSRLRQLRTLKLCCHDRSGGANLAALLGGRRPPAVARLELAASVRDDSGRVAAAADAGNRNRRVQLPPVTLDVHPGPGRIQDIRIERDMRDVVSYDAVAGVLSAAARQLPAASASGAGGHSIGRLRMPAFPSCTEPGAENDFLRCLGPTGRLARLAAQCERVELGQLDASSKAVSTAAVCAVVGVLGLPETFELQHGILVGRAVPASQSQSELAVTSSHASSAATAAAAVRPTLPRTGRPPLQLESATAEGVVREVVERLWLASTAADAEAEAGGVHEVGNTAEDGWADTLVLLRGAPPPQPPWCDHHKVLRAWLDGLVGGPESSVSAAAAAAGTAAGAAATSVAAGAAAVSSGGVQGPSRYVNVHAGIVSVPCVDAVLLPCRTRADAVALAAAVAAANSTAAGGAGAGGRRRAEAAILPDHVVPSDCRLPMLYACGDTMSRAVLQVLQEVWSGRRGAAGASTPDSKAGGARAGGGGHAAGDLGAWPDSRRGLLLGGAALSMLQRLVDLDAGAAKLWRED